VRRREFIGLLGGVAAWPLAARAQQSGKLPTIGYLGSGTPTSQRTWITAFVERLRELGWIEGRTITIVYRWAEAVPSDLSKSPESLFSSRSTSFLLSERKQPSR
jgi:hypothetical protein